MKRHRLLRTDRKRGQFFTEPQFAELLVAAVAGGTSSAVDFAMGNGALLDPVIRAYADCEVFGIDVDARWVRRIRRAVPAGSFVSGDALVTHSLASLRLPADGVDLVVANPPFADIANTPRIGALIAHTLGLNPRGRSVRSEIAFLALALSALAPRGRLSIVLPQALIAGDTFRAMRNAIVARFSISGVYELPRGAFAATEAHTYILSLERGAPASTSIPVYSVDGDGNLAAAECIRGQEVTRRWDYGYWKWERRRASGAAPTATLEELGGVLYRGQVSSAEARRSRLPYFHTTDFARLRRDSVSFYNPFEAIRHVPRELRAGAGDILIPRIGTRCLGHQALVSRGTAAITDCVYRIHLPPEHRQATLLSLASDRGLDWRRKSAKGTCAKFLTRTDMLRFPVYLS